MNIRNLLSLIHLSKFDLKRVFITILFIALFLTSNAAVFYVNSEGDDNNSGTSPGPGLANFSKSK